MEHNPKDDDTEITTKIVKFFNTVLKEDKFIELGNFIHDVRSDGVYDIERGDQNES